MNPAYKFGLIGHRINYSKSPDIFKSIFDRTCLDGSFECCDFPPEQLEQKFRHLIEGGISGVSVTIPYKAKVLDYLTTVDKEAQIIGAVNSIKLEGDKSYGFNTDTYGFSLGLKAHREQVTGRPATILGCGGAAAAAVCSLYSDYGVRQFQVYGRTQDKLDTFVTRLKKHLIDAEFGTTKFTSTGSTPILPIIIVNCTPLGGGSFPKENPLPQSLNWKETKVYYDLNYNADNPAIIESRNRGVTALDGRMMLVGQAVRSFKIWTGEDVDIKLVFEDVFGKE